MDFFQIKRFILFDNILEYIKLFTTQGTSRYDINVTCTSSPRDGLLKFFKFGFRYVFSFCKVKKLAKSSVKIPWGFDSVVYMDILLWFFSLDTYIYIFHYILKLWLIAYKNHSKFFKRKCKKQRYVYCVYNSKSFAYINSNMALLRVRNHQKIIHNKVLDNWTKKIGASFICL